MINFREGILHMYTSIDMNANLMNDYNLICECMIV